MMNNRDNRSIAIYSRKSKFTGKGESIENQIELCRQYITLHFPEANAENICVYEDEGFSGGNTQRPQFKNMLKSVREGNIGTIICYRLDRISRNTGDFAKLIDELDSRKVEFVSIRDNFDTTTPTGRAMMMMVSVFSQLERETIAERIRDNMHELAKTGRWLGGATPTGYKSERVEKTTADGKVRSLYKLDMIDEEAEIIRLIFHQFLETNSLTKVETYLLVNHITTKNGKRFTRFTIKSILTNPVYMAADMEAWNYFEQAEIELYSEKEEFDGTHGIMAYNKTSQTTGRANQINDMNEWIIAVGKHRPLISGANWVKVQKMLEQNKSKSYRKPRSNIALLSGLLFCGNCGDYMRPKLSKRVNKDGEQIYSYLCETKEKSRCQICDSKNPNGNIVDALVCEEIKKLSDNSSGFIQQLEKAKKQIRENGQEYDTQLENCKKELVETEKQIKALITALSKSEGTTTYAYVNTQIEELHQKKTDMENRIEELKSLTQNHQLSDQEFDILRDMLVSFAHSFETMNIEEKRAALRTFIKKVVWDGENVHVYLFGANEDEIDFPNEAETEPSGAYSKRSVDVFENQ